MVTITTVSRYVLTTSINRGPRPEGIDINASGRARAHQGLRALSVDQPES